MVDDPLMNPINLFLDNGDTITRRQWLAGTVLLVVALWLLSGAVHANRAMLWRYEAGIQLFASIAALIPFHALNVRRLRDRGRPEWLALMAAMPPAAASLSLAFRPVTGPLGTFDIAVGLALVAMAIWMVVDLGLGPSRRTASRWSAIRA
jgi:uncharacterized membrane protein YhaH (DUF805 family)